MFRSLDEALIGLGVQCGRIVCNVGFGNPAGLRSLNAQLEQAFVDLVDELLRIGVVCR